MKHRNNLIYGFVLLGLALGFLEAPRAAFGEEEGKPYPLVVIDIAALVEPVKDFPGPRFELSAGRALESLLRDEGDFFEGQLQAHRPRILTLVDLEELIRESDPVWESDLERIRLEIINRRLFIQGPPDAVKRLRSLLRVLEEEASRTLHVRAILVEVPAGTGTKWLGKTGTVLDGAGLPARLRAVKIAGGRVIADASVSALNGQRVHVVDGRERSFLVDYNVVLAKGTAEADPIVEVFRDGLILDVRPIASPSGAMVRLDLSVGYTRFDGNMVRFDPENPKLGPLDLPRLTGYRMESSVAIPKGDALLLGPLMPSPVFRLRDAVKPADLLPGKKDTPDGASPGKEDEPKGDVYLIVTVKGS